MFPMFLTPGRLWKGIPQIHAHSLKGNTYDWERYKWSKVGLWGVGSLAVGAALEEILELCVHPRPEKVIFDLFQCVLALR